MSIKTGNLVKVITKNSTHEGKTGKVVHVFEDEKTVTVTFDSGSGIISGFFVTELELADPRREALIELAETLDTARLQAKVRLDAKADSGLQALHNSIDSVLVSTLLQIIVEHDDLTEVYDYILDGKTVREALALAVESNGE